MRGDHLRLLAELRTALNVQQHPDTIEELLERVTDAIAARHFYSAEFLRMTTQNAELHSEVNRLRIAVRKLAPPEPLTRLRNRRTGVVHDQGRPQVLLCALHREIGRPADYEPTYAPVTCKPCAKRRGEWDSIEEKIIRG